MINTLSNRDILTYIKILTIRNVPLIKRLLTCIAVASFCNLPDVQVPLLIATRYCSFAQFLLVDG